MTKVLVVDNDPMVCEVVADLMEVDLAAEVKRAMTGALAAEAIDGGAFDLAIIDVLMPEISGFKLAERAANKNIPSLLCTGHPDALTKLQEHGYPHVAKPFNVADLLHEAAKAITATAYATQAGLDVVQDYCDVGVSGRREGRPQLNALMAAVRNHEIDCVLVWKFDRFARSTRHLLVALEEFNHLGVRFISVQDQVDTDSPMGRAMFTIIGAMAELESSLISERVTAGMKAAEVRGKHLGRPATQQRVIREIETLATSTNLSIRQIQSKLAGRASRGLIGEITKRARDQLVPVALPTSLETNDPS